MKSNNLTISVPTPPCKRNCPYCVTKMTGRVEADVRRFERNLVKAVRLARVSNVNNILITGKGEPLDNFDHVKEVWMRFYEYPIEIQIDGHRYIGADYKLINALDEFDVIALSFHRLPKRIPKWTNGITRLTLVVTDFTNVGSFHEVIDYCKRNKIDQLSLRKPTVPAHIQDTPESRRTAQWIHRNTHMRKYEWMIKEFMYRDYPPVRRLPFGATIYDVEGISFTHFDYCVQDSNNDDEIRSLIYMEDGHMYTSWTYQSSKIF